MGSRKRLEPITMVGVLLDEFLSSQEMQLVEFGNKIGAKTKSSVNCWRTGQKVKGERKKIYPNLSDLSKIYKVYPQLAIQMLEVGVDNG